MVNRFMGNGLCILDEPEAALSPSRQLAVLSRMFQLIEQQSQFIVATHSPILVAYPGAKIHHVGEHGNQQVQYEETEHLRSLKHF